MTATDTLRKELGAAITKARGKRSLGQLAGLAVISKSALVRLEQGERQTLTLGLAQDIAGALGTGASRVFGRHFVRYGRGGKRPPVSRQARARALEAARVVPMEHVVLILHALQAEAPGVDAVADELGGSFGPMLERAGDLLLDRAG